MNARFVTEDGAVVPAVTAERMREIDRIAMEETGPNLFQMMENAGRTLASRTIALLGNGWRGARVVVLAGSGGNGGGGICAHEIDATQVARQRPDVIVDALIGYGLREAERL